MKDIKNYEGLYAVTSCGKVWSYKRKKFLVPKHSVKGYLFVSLWKDGVFKTKLIHRLVAEAYIPNPNNMPQINHRDENKENNCLQNLEWCDAKYNNNYGTRNDKIKKPILQFTLDGEFVREWPSASDVSKEIQSNIVSCLKGKRKSACGYIWRYKN